MRNFFWEILHQISVQIIILIAITILTFVYGKSIPFLTLCLPVYSFIIIDLLIILFFYFLILVFNRIKNNKLVVVSAFWGIGKNRVDISNRLNEYICNNKLNEKLDNQMTGVQDPSKGDLKTCIIKYKYGHITRESNYVEYKTIKLPTFSDILNSLVQNTSR